MNMAATLAQQQGSNRSTTRFSALQSLAAEQDTEIEDELARCTSTAPVSSASHSPAPA